MAQANARTHYETLGLSETAPLEDVRRRFRELARRCHPDVDRSPGAAGRFKEINEAHRVLSDADRRAKYDSDLRLRRASRAAPAQPGVPSRKAQSQTEHAPRQQGSAQTAGVPGPGLAAQAMLDKARTHFGKMQFAEAEDACRKAINLARRYAPAYELMGDIHRARGRRNEALSMYTYALQLEPRSPALRTKFDRLMDLESSAHAGRPGRRGFRPLPLLVSVPLMAGLVYALASAPEPAAAPMVPVEWSPATMLVLVAAGLIGGLALALSGQLSAAREELLFTASGRSGTSTVPLGVILVGFALMWFYASFVVYLVIAARQDRVSQSVLLAFGGALLITALFAVACPASLAPLLAFGANFVFVGFIAGWAAAFSIH